MSIAGRILPHASETSQSLLSLPLKEQERAACSTRCPVGPEEIITHGLTGVLVPPADENALAEAVLRVLKDAELRQRLSANGPRRAADFATERIVSQYKSIFQRLVYAA